MKYKEIAKMTQEELDKKMKELKIELVKAKAKTSKTGNPREIKKLIARISTFNTFKQEKLKNK